MIILGLRILWGIRMNLASEKIDIILSKFHYKKSTVSQHTAGLFGKDAEVTLANKKFEIYTVFINNLEKLDGELKQLERRFPEREMQISEEGMTRLQIFIDEAAGHAWYARQHCITQGSKYYDRKITYFQQPGTFETNFKAALMAAGIQPPRCLAAHDSTFRNNDLYAFEKRAIEVVNKRLLLTNGF